MTREDARALLPLVILASSALAVLLGVACRRSRTQAATLSLAGLAGTLLAAAFSGARPPRQVGPLLVVDEYGLFFVGLFSAASLAIGAISWAHPGEDDDEEYYALLALATLGAAVLALSRHFAALFLGLELLSVSLYAMIGYPRQGRRPVEAGLKYLILHALSSAFLLFGMALVFAARGSLDFSGAVAATREDAPWVVAGLSLIAVGVGYKLALVPFHMWSPDVYEGAPVLTTAFLATVSKGSLWALVFRLVPLVGANGSEVFPKVALVGAVVSMTVGNILALRQENLRRLLAYSSIAHAGFFLCMVPGGGQAAVRGAIYYLVAYVVTILGAFGVMAILSFRGTDRDDLEQYRGLVRRAPWRAGLLTLFLLSLAGLPLTAGFLGKFEVIAAGVRSALWIPAFFFVANSALALYYYLRAGVTLYLSPTEPASREIPRTAAGAAVALLALTVIVILLGVYPSSLDRVIDRALGFVVPR